jgi:serine/threonine protein kinase
VHILIAPAIDRGRYLVSELCQISLADLLGSRRDAPSLTQRARWMLEVCYGMVKLHSLGVVHRDIKLDNVRAFLLHRLCVRSKLFGRA